MRGGDLPWCTREAWEWSLERHEACPDDLLVHRFGCSCCSLRAQLKASCALPRATGGLLCRVRAMRLIYFVNAMSKRPVRISRISNQQRTSNPAASSTAIRSRRDKVTTGVCMHRAANTAMRINLVFFQLDGVSPREEDTYR